MKNSYFYIVISILFIAMLCLTNSQAFAKENYQSSTEEEFDSFDDEFDDFGAFEDRKKPEDVDPFEKINRKIYAFNDTFDKYFFEHVARAYRKIIPKKARSIVTNFISNLKAPVSALNSIAQGKVNNSLATISNFLINSTIGLGGMFNVAADNNIRYNNETFAQTLGYYGVPSGAYLMVPFLGPSSIRDFSGWSVDRSIDPMGFNLLRIGRKYNIVDQNYRTGLALLSAVDKRERLLDIIGDVRKESFDPYVTIRSAYLQQMISEIKK